MAAPYVLRADRAHSHVRAAGAGRKVAPWRGLSAATFLAVILVAAVAPRPVKADVVAPNDPLYAQQWNLARMNVPAAWALGYTGAGQTIAYIDGGVEITHPDLAANYRFGVDLVHNDNDPSPDPSASLDIHGTAVVGLGSATANNNEGIAGIAYSAGYGVIQAMPASGSLNFNDPTGYARIATALRFNPHDVRLNALSGSFSERNSYGSLSNSYYDDLTAAAMEGAARGTLVVVSAGNSMAQHGVQAGYDGNAGNKFLRGTAVFVIGAITADNRPAPYSNVGPCVIACAPSGDTIFQGGSTIPTTDRTGSAGYNPSQDSSSSNPNYTGFTGTSASAPQIAACLVLAGEAHSRAFGDTLPGVDRTRYYQHLVVESSSLEGIQLTRGSFTNTGGQQYSHECGFGVIDAARLCVNATAYEGVTPAVTHSSGLISAGNTLIPLGDSVGVSKTITVESSDMPLEQVLVRICINSDSPVFRASCFGTIEGWIESPNGTRSQFVFANPLASYVVDASTLEPIPFDFTYTCYDFYGELGVGPLGSVDWKVTLDHPFASNGSYDRNYYTWSSLEVTTISGELIAVPEPASLALLGIGSVLLLRRRRQKHDRPRACKAACQIHRVASCAGVFVLALAVLGGAVRPVQADVVAPNDPLYAQQWNLGRMNVPGAWALGYTGAGQTIAYVDSGVEITHPDLKDNYDASLSIDLLDNDPDPSADPTGSLDIHGTSVAGLGSATANNNEGIAGIAYGAKYGVIRVLPTSGILNGNDTAGYARLAAGLRYSPSDAHIDVKVFSIIENGSYGQLTWPYWKDMDAAARDAANSGTLVVVSAGNSMARHGVVAGYDGNAGNKFLSGPSVFKIGAITADNRPAAYSNVGPCILACAPSGDTLFEGGSSVPSTDRVGAGGFNPTYDASTADQGYVGFTGTSACAPEVGALLANAGEAHNTAFGDNLTGVDRTRYYQHLVVESSSLEGIQLTRGSVTNFGGKRYSHECGFGVIDAARLCVNATAYEGITPAITHSSGLISAGNTLIPLSDSVGVSKTVTVESSDMPLEQVLVRICINSDSPDSRADSYGQIEGYITSPNGTKSQFVFANPLASSVVDPNTFRPVPLDFVFTCYDFYGELGASQFGSEDWLVELSHPNASNGSYDRNYYKWSSLEVMTISGELIAVPEPASLALLGMGASALLRKRRARNATTG